ncbi:MAG: Holliday junction branch migration protein RuvA [Patescibacteria group bacterium]|nr:Holliday junction branch migration protein RuvA [Patescibacteria group bacterium]
MISYLQGKIIFKGENFIILDVQGVGYEVFLAQKTLNKIPQIEENLKLFCYLDVGERSLKLFGFLKYEELEFFKLLRAISGVGPKAALEISGIGPPKKIKKEIEKGDEQIFEGVSGIGKKKAKKIILELSGKLKTLAPPSKKETLLEDEAFLALTNLGFQKEEIKKALSQLPKETKSPQERVKEALKFLGKK